MPSSFEVPAYPLKSIQPASVSFQSLFPIATGGLPINTLGTGIATGTFPGPTGSLQSNPSGVPLYFRPAGATLLTRVSAGLYQLVFAPAPNGSIRVWQEFTASLATPRQVAVTKRDIATGYVQVSVFSESGTLMDFANGDMVGIEYTAYSTGNAAGP